MTWRTGRVENKDEVCGDIWQMLTLTGDNWALSAMENYDVWFGISNIVLNQLKQWILFTLTHEQKCYEKVGKSIENHVHLQCTFQKYLEDFLKSWKISKILLDFFEMCIANAWIHQTRWTLASSAMKMWGTSPPTCV